MEHSKIKNFALFVNKLNDWVGRLVCVLILPMIAILLYEVVMRYVFDRPTVWAHETSGMLYTVYFLLGGAYTLRWGGHIQIEFLYVRLSPRKRAILDCCTWLFFYLFAASFYGKGSHSPGSPFWIRSCRALPFRRQSGRSNYSFPYPPCFFCFKGWLERQR